MLKATLYALTFLALVFTVPWWFVRDSDTRVLGMPGWAFFALAASAAYAAVISFCIGRFWNVSAGGDRPDQPEDGEE